MKSTAKPAHPSVQEFADNPHEFLRQLRANDMPMVLSVDGEPAVVVCDLRLYEFLARSDQRDLREVLELRVRKMDSGEDEGIPAEQVFRELRAELAARAAAKPGKKKR
jgi:PHD/YefM family antitoxin component YafN of YafNO toxin-antitoxin module